MLLVRLLRDRSEDILAAGTQAVRCRHLRSYERAGAEGIRTRLEALLDRVVTCIEERHLDPMVAYGEELGRERFSSGFELAEVQTVVNVLEELLWKEAMEGLPPENYREALGLISTLLGAAKNALACSYVSLASKSHVTTLDVESLLKGTEPGFSE